MYKRIYIYILCKYIMYIYIYMNIYIYIYTYGYIYIFIYYYFCSEIGTTILKVSVVFKPTKTTWFENPSTFISKATIHDSLSLSLS